MNLEKTELLYKDVLIKTRDEVSLFLNNKLNNHDDKLKSLKNLIISGEINYKYAILLNGLLVQELKNIRNNKKEEAPIFIRNLSESEADFLLSKFEERLNQTPAEAGSFFFNYFKDEMHKKFFNFNGDTLSEDSLLTIKEIGIKTPNFDSLIENYIKNYSQILVDESARLTWNESDLLSYVEHVETIVYSQNGVDTILADKIYEAVDLLSFNVLEKQHIGLLNKEKKEALLKNIRDYLQELVNVNSSELTKVIKVARERIISKVNELFERANKEIFPSIIKERMDKLNFENNLEVQKLTEMINDLEEERDQIMSVLYFEKLDTLKNHLENKIELMEITTYAQENDAYNILFIKSDSEMAEFMGERNKYSIIIKKQLSTEDGSYFHILNKIKSLKSEFSDSKEELLLYFYQSIELFASELKESLLGLLDYNFEQFMAGDFQEFGVRHAKRIADLDQVFKTNSLIFINNFKEKINQIKAIELLDEIKKTRKLVFIQDDDLNDFLEHLDSLVLSKISLNDSERQFFLQNKELIKSNLRYETDSEEARLSFNIISAVFTASVGIIGVSTGGLALAVAVGIAGASPSLWERFSRDKDFYENKYKIFLEEYLNKMKSGFIIE